MSRTVRRVGVLGLGTMGAGIVEVLARAELAVVAVEPAAEAVSRGREHLSRSTERAVARGKLSRAEQQALTDRVAFGTNLDDLADVDLVVEAVPELPELKAQVFRDLDARCRADAVLATNTSSLSVTRLAAATARPERVVGMHFFNPAPVLRLVEVVSTVVTDPAVVTDVADLARALGKQPVVVGDRAGFVANALLFGYLNRAVALFEAGAATADDLDTAVRVGAGLPLGPLALLDLIGLDTAVQILESMYAESYDPLHAPAPLLRRLVADGRLGRKSGAGFSTYGEAPAPVAPTAAGREPDGTSGAELVEALIYPHLNDAVRMLESGYATVDDIDLAMRLGCGYPAGPFEMLDDVGLDVVLEGQQRIFDESGQPGLAPARLLRQLVAVGWVGRRCGRGFRTHATTSPASEG